MPGSARSRCIPARPAHTCKTATRSSSAPIAGARAMFRSALVNAARGSSDKRAGPPLGRLAGDASPPLNRFSIKQAFSPLITKGLSGSMASVPAEEEVAEAPRSRRLLPNVRPVTTLLATAVVWITGLLVACCLAGGYLRHQVLNTTADELRRLDTVLAEATTRSLQGIDPILGRLADRLRGSGDISPAAPRSGAPALENAGGAAGHRAFRTNRRDCADRA